MGYKKWGKEISFADLAVSKSLEHNRSLKMMMSIDKVVRPLHNLPKNVISDLGA